MSKIKPEIELPFTSDAFVNAWNQWLMYRAQRRLPKYVPIGLQKTLTGLVRDSGGDEGTAIAIINNSIEKNWQGLFPLKNTNNGTISKPTATERRANNLNRFLAKGQAAFNDLVASGGTKGYNPEV